MTSSSFARTLRLEYARSLVSHSQMMLTSSFGEVLELYSSLGTEREPLLTEELRVFQTIGVLQ